MATIGLFDSGSGGLSVYREIVKLLPGERYIYFADRLYCPYGEKSRGFIIERARVITEFLISRGADIIVVACNTATAAAIATLRTEYPVPFVGMEPAVRPAALGTRSGVIGVLATAGTLKASKYLDMRDRYADGITVVEKVGEGFVELVESGELDGEHAERVIRRSVEPLISAGADHIVLGCTHYPFLKKTIQKVILDLNPEREVCIIDPAPAAARQTVRMVKENGIPVLGQEERMAGNIELCSSESTESLERIIRLIT